MNQTLFQNFKLNQTSLRLRLCFIILVPLILISVLIAFWRYEIAFTTSEELFDATLVAVAVAISRDVLVSDGDALSSTTLELLKKSGNGKIFYHMSGPDGIFLTGYAYPPYPGANSKSAQDGIPTFFDSTYRSESVRVVRLREKTSFLNISGYSVVTVWENMKGRNEFALEQFWRSLSVMITLIICLTFLIWFGVRFGLRPLTKLENNIKARSSRDLKKINLKVPVEISELVDKLNDLFQKVTDGIVSRESFLSAAAHQLRNPIAGLLVLAEATRDAKDPESQNQRAGKLVEATTHLSRLIEQLLTYERVQGITLESQWIKSDLNILLEDVCKRNAVRILGRKIEFSFTALSHPAKIQAEPFLLSEAFENLIDNVLNHAGENNNKLEIWIEEAEQNYDVFFADQGCGIPERQRTGIFERFQKNSYSQGSGLGLSIVKDILRQHQGSIKLIDVKQGTTFQVILPKIAG